MNSCPLRVPASRRVARSRDIEPGSAAASPSAALRARRGSVGGKNARLIQFASCVKNLSGLSATYGIRRRVDIWGIRLAVGLVLAIVSY